MEGTETRKVSVENNRQASLIVEPWLKDKSMQIATAGYTTNLASGNITYNFNKKSSAAIEVQLINQAQATTNESAAVKNFFKTSKHSQ